MTAWRGTIRSMCSLLRGQSGTALIFVLAFMALAVPLTTAALSFVSTAALDSAIKTQSVHSQYANQGASQYGVWRLAESTGYAESLVIGVPDQEVVTINGADVTITWERLANPGGSEPTPSTSPLRTSKVVSQSTIPADVATTLTYTITVANEGSESSPVWRVKDGLPVGFPYQTGTTSGITTNDPTVQVFNVGGGNDYELLTWDLAFLDITLAPTESFTLQFDVQANVPTGAYCNEAWADPGGKKNSSGPTAVVWAGGNTDACETQLIEVRKTVDTPIVPSNTATLVSYTIEIENLGSATYTVDRIRDYPAPNIVYILGTTGGDITSADPFTWSGGGQTRMRWSFLPSGVDIGPGQTRTLTFQATATLDAGLHQNEVWVEANGNSNSGYSWPTAEITVFDVYKVDTADTRFQSTAMVWLGQDEFRVSTWDVIK